MQFFSHAQKDKVSLERHSRPSVLRDPVSLRDLYTPVSSSDP